MLRQKCIHHALRRPSIIVRPLKLRGQSSNLSSLSSLQAPAPFPHSIYTPHSHTSCNPLQRSLISRRFASTTTQPNPIGDQKPSLVEAEFNPTDSLQSIDPYSDQTYKVDEHVGYLKELGLDYGWGCTSMVEWIFEHAYLYSGLSWGTTIIVLTTAFRLGMMKLMMRSSDNQARMAVVRDKAKDIDARLKEATFNGDTRQQMMVGEERRKLMAAYGIKPLRSFAPILVQIPLGVGSFRLLRGMGALPMPGFETAGFLWFTDLSMSDPYCILPLIAAGCYFTSFQISSRSGLMPPPSFATKVVLQGIIPAVAFAVGIFLPASIQVSFTITGFFAMLQAFFFGNARFREAFGMFPMPAKVNQDAAVSRTINIRGRTVTTGKPVEVAPEGIVPKIKWHLSNTKKEFVKSVEDTSKLMGTGPSQESKRKKSASRNKHKR